MRIAIFILCWARLGLAGGTQVVDSIVASVDRIPIKHSDVIREIRLTALQNSETPDFGPASQKEATERLIEQAIIRGELEAGMLIPEDPEASNQLLIQMRGLYGGEAPLRSALSAAGISEAELLKRLKWQTTVLRFIQMRFARALESDASSMNDAFFAWLEQSRQDKRIVVREERLK